QARCWRAGGARCSTTRAISGASSTSSSRGRGMVLVRRRRDAGAPARQGEVEGRAAAGRRIDPQPTPVRLHDPLANGEPGAGPLVLAAPVQPPEDAEDLLVVG